MSFKVVFNGETKTFDHPVTVLEVVGGCKDYITATINGRVKDLNYVLKYDCEVKVLTVKDRYARNCYEASLRFIVAMAMHNLYPDVDVKFSYNVSRSIFMQILTPRVLCTGQMVRELDAEIERIVEADYPLIKHVLPKEEIEKIFDEIGCSEKKELLKYRPEPTAHIYDCHGYKNYMYNRMVPSTGYIKKWNLKYYQPGIIIQYPRAETNGEIPQFESSPTFHKTLKRATQWANATGADTVVGINKLISKAGPVDFINLCEANHNRQLCELGEMIEADRENIRLICIAGPSSSGKTTFSNRLRIELLSRGIQPVRISLDDYYLPRDKIPCDENGEKDFETIYALDIDGFNKDMSDLIAGEEVTLRKYSFASGCSSPFRTLRLPNDQPIIIEGIHALNDLMTSSIPNNQKFKIFIAPQAQVNYDAHNPMSLTDLRLLRRIVRDYQFRNCGAAETLSMWNNVRKGEFKWIYGTQEGADYVFNSFLPYELPVMKKYAMPLLKEIADDDEYRFIAERLIRMLKFFVDMPDEWVPCNSLMREFIGGSCYADV